MEIKVAIIEDSKEYQDILKVIVNGTAGFVCKKVYSNGKAAISGIRHEQVDVILTDLGLPDIEGTEIIKTLKSEFPAIQFIVISISDDEEKIFEALTAGAEGYLTKDTNHSKIIESIHQVLNGGAPMSAGIARKVLRFFSGSTSEMAETYKNVLTKRETEVLELLVQGLSYKAIGERMYISVETVKTHCHNIYKKLHVKSKDALISKVYNQNPLVFRLQEEIRVLKEQLKDYQQRHR